MVGFLGSIIGDGGNLDDEQLIHNIIYASIFCFTQDIPNDVKIVEKGFRMETQQLQHLLKRGSNKILKLIF